MSPTPGWKVSTVPLSKSGEQLQIAPERMTEEPGGAQSMGLQQSDTTGRLSNINKDQITGFSSLTPKSSKTSPGN